MDEKQNNTVWPEWEMEEKPLGRGAYGAVYKAVRNDHGVESYSAIKIISIPADSSEVDSLRSEGLDMNATRTFLQGIVTDFVSEIQLMESLKGIQNIVSVEDYKVVEKSDEIGWDIYIRMELLTSFNNYICDKKLTEEEVIKLGCDICTALEICAKRNIIHRDIKPANIFINDFGYFKLGDFGIARKMENMSGGLSQKGTPDYMAPEVANNGEYDGRVDIYSLGLVLYRLLNDNKPPFLDTEKQLLSPNERKIAWDRRIRGEELPAPCDSSPAMTDLILRACAYDPDMRFSSAAEMKQALMSVANGTYQIGVSNLERTTSVRKAANSYDRTTSVRKAPATTNQKATPAIDTFGSAPKKKRKMPVVIATVLAVVFLACAGIFVMPKLLDGNDGNESTETSDTGISETADYSKLDEERIASIISEADALAAVEDYEGALAKVKTGLATYPKSATLQDKVDEYTASLNAQIKAEALINAKSFAQQKDYLNAYKTIGQAVETVGEDSELTIKATEYEEAYVTDVSSRIDVLLADNDVSAAKELLQSAEKEFPKNEAIKLQLEELNKYKTVTLDSITPINGGFNWNDGAPEDPFGLDYSSVRNYTIYHGDGNNCHYHYSASAEYKINQQYDIFQFTISPYSHYGENATSYVKVYVDDVLRYVSPAITQKSGATNVEVDVKDSTYLKIVIDKGNYGCVMLSDAVLTSVPNYISNYETGITSVAVLNPINGGFTWESGVPSNIMGDSYINTANYAIYHGDGNNCHYHYTGSTEYYLAGKYTSLSLDLAPYSDFGQDAKTVVKIYVDDVLAYTGTITQKSGKIGTGDINVKDAQYLKIVIEKGNYGCVILSDILLKNAE